MKQTAVEWLLDWMEKNQYFIGNDLLQAVEQAKAMEKEQLIEFTTNYFMESHTKSVNQYYNETFKSE